MLFFFDIMLLCQEQLWGCVKRVVQFQRRGDEVVFIIWLELQVNNCEIDELDVFFCLYNCNVNFLVVFGVKKFRILCFKLFFIDIGVGCSSYIIEVS